MELHCKAGRITDQSWQVYNAILPGLHYKRCPFSVQKDISRVMKSHLLQYERCVFLMVPFYKDEMYHAILSIILFVFFLKFLIGGRNTVVLGWIC